MTFGLILFPIKTIEIVFKSTTYNTNNVLSVFGILFSLFFDKCIFNNTMQLFYRVTWFMVSFFWDPKDQIERDEKMFLCL